MKERAEARRFNQELDQLLHRPLPGAPDAATEAARLDTATLATVARLAVLPSLLAVPEADFEQRVWAQVRAVEAVADRSHRSRPRLGWPSTQVGGWRWLAPAAAALLVILLVLPGPRQALGNWMARFRLDAVEVAVTPEETVRPQLVGNSQAYVSLAEAESDIGLALLKPAYLPSGYGVAGVQAVSFEGLPVWMQPLYVEVTYGPPDASPDVSYYAALRQFNAGRAGAIRVGQIEFQSEAVRTALDITLPNGLAAVLVEFDSDQGRDDVLLRQVIWEQDNMTLELWSQVLPVAEMLRIAASLE